MPHYTLHPSQDTFSSRRFLIGPPLLLVAAFCFGLVMMQAHNHSQAASVSASRPTTKLSSTESKLSSKLSPVSASTTQSKISATTSTEPPIAQTSQTTPTTASNPPATTNPQSSNSPAANPQPAASPLSDRKRANKPGFLKQATEEPDKILKHL